MLGQEGLEQLKDPPFVFEADFDLVAAPGEIAVPQLETFNWMFADLDTLVSAASANARRIAAPWSG